jgi:glycosyltransferase involved in cell wall biosynthesis
MSNTPFFSIVIPTRNRPQTLFYTIQTVLNQTFSNFELIISDNSDNDATQEMLNKNTDTRILYYKTNGKLCMAENWESALRYIKGKFVLIIGDDDGLCQNALDISYDYIVNKKPDVLMFNWAGYIWPEQNDPRIIPNQLSISLNDDEEGLINSKRILRQVVFSHALYYSLPSIYYSFVSADLIGSIILRKGRFFNSIVPDVYSGILICSISDNIYKTNKLLGVRGASQQANGIAFIYKNENNSSLRADFNDLNNLSALKWNDSVPNVFCYYAFTLETYFQFCEEFKIPISQWKLAIFYLKIIRNIYFGYANDKVKVKNDLDVIRETIKKNKRILKILKRLLLIYNHKLAGNNEKRNIVISANKSENFGFNKGVLLINGFNFNIKNILDVQLFLNNLLN